MKNDYVWLNELSQQFLDTDYLINGQTVDERVDVIFNTAEKILNKPGFAARIKENFKKGWYSLSSPIWSNFGTNRGVGISCVTGDTWINTKIDGGKLAKDICIGDEVLTHKGRYRKVSDVIVTNNRSNIYKIKICNRMTNLYITENHLVLTNMGWVRVDELDASKHLVAINREIELPEIKCQIDLKKHCNYEFVIKEGRICKKPSENPPPHKRVDSITSYSCPFEKIDFDEDMAWAFGLWFAEGSIAINENKNPNGARITVSKDEKEDLGDRWLQIICSKFGINGKGYLSEVTRDEKINSWYSVSVNSGIVGNLFSSFGKGCKNKTIPQWIIESPKEILSNFIKGMLDGDGSIKKDGSCKITLANPKLILQIYQIGLKLGMKMSLQMQEKAGLLATTRYVYTIIFRNQKIGTGRFSSNSAIDFNDGLSYASIRTIELTEKIEDVYDFTVEEDHSFSAAGVVLHNCFGSHISDSMQSILSTVAEVGMMTKGGGGTSGYFGDLRPRGSEIKDNGVSHGPVHFAKLYEVLIQIVSQGSSRRGQFAAYLPVTHPDIMEFLKIRSEGNSIQDLSFGVCVPDVWMEEMIGGDASKRVIWAKILECRSKTGYPYVFFTDNANNGAPEVYKDKGMKITHSNLCNEISLPDCEDESFVCDLSSMNILYYDDWKDTDAVELLVNLLDAVMTDFIERSKSVAFMERAVKFAERHRAIGIGWLGWHSYLQSKMIAFESMEAKIKNIEIAKKIKDSAYKASQKMAEEYGEPEVLKGYGRRHTTLCAIAPTKSSAFILGQVSEGIEPNRTNYYIKDLQKGKFSIRNIYLEKLLEEKGLNMEEVWGTILKNGGSVQHLKCLSEHEKNVFKTFSEISQLEVVIQAAQRQKHIDQGQSLNLMIHPSIPIKDVNSLMIEGWRMGVKGYYYQHSANAAQMFSRNLMSCSSCES